MGADSPRRRLFSFARPVPPAPAAPGTTYAPDAAPSPWRNTNYATSTAGATLAAMPGAAQTLARAAVPTAPASAARTTFAGFTPEQGELVRAAGAADRATPLGDAFGSARIIASAGSNPSRQTSAATNPDGSQTFGTANGGSATIQPAGADTGESGIFVDGKAVTHDKAGNLVAAAPSGQNPAQKFAGDQAVAVAMYPQLGVAGSPENKKFVDAYKAGGNNQDGVLDLAKSLFGVPNQQADANPVRNAKDVDATQVAAARATGDANVAAVNNAPNAGTQAGQNVRSAVTGAVGATGGALDTASKNVGGFVDGVAGISEAQRKGLSDVYGFDSSNLGATPFKGFAPPSDAPKAPGLSPTGTPVGPATNSLAGSDADPVKAATDNLAGAVDASRAQFKGFTPPGATTAGSAAGLSSGTGGTPAAPAVDPAELERRRIAAARATSTP